MGRLVQRSWPRLVLTSIFFFAAATALLFLTTMGLLVGSAKLMARPSRNPVPVLKAPPTDQEIAAEVAALIAMLQKRKFKIEDPRLPAAIRLGEIGPPAIAAVPALKKMTTNKDPVVSNAAKVAIASITGPPRKHPLVSWLFP